MKKIIQYISFAFAIGGMVVLSSCGGDGPSASAVMTKKLIAHPWNLSSATVDGVDKTSTYTGLSITFSKTNYTATNGAPIWPTSGTWEFTDKKASGFIRNDDLVVEILEATSTSLKLSFSWDATTFEPGRTKSVGGNHVFTFTE